MLVRTWNLFHGNTVPPRREARLGEMVRLAAADGPAVVCLQEIPVWALERLDDWSGMVALGEVAARPRVGLELGRKLTELHHGLLRSAFTGQANAVLVAAGLRVLDRDAVVLNSREFRRREAARLGLSAPARLAWARERRVCQSVRLALPDGRTMTVANLHATKYAADRRLAHAEVLRAAVFLDAVASPGDVCVLAGDLNVATGTSLDELVSWGFSRPGPGVDHILVRGAAAGPEVRWPRERRLVDGLLLSDHAPVEVTVE
jgi:endonuclease/exonuclease/phosphatase family metal-dependent hydrolase